MADTPDPIEPQAGPTVAQIFDDAGAVQAVDFEPTQTTVTYTDYPVCDSIIATREPRSVAFSMSMLREGSDGSKAVIGRWTITPPFDLANTTYLRDMQTLQFLGATVTWGQTLLELFSAAIDVQQRAAGLAAMADKPLLPAVPEA